MKKRKAVPVVYKDTKFEWCIDIDYPRSIINRYVFFYTLSKSYRKTLNYANHFVADNKICVVFIYGKYNTNSIFEAMCKMNGKCVVIAYGAPIFDLVTDRIQDHKKLYEILKQRGYLKDGKFNEERRKEFEQVMNYTGEDSELFEGLRDEWRKIQECEQNYERAIRYCNEMQYGTFEYIENFTTPKHITGDNANDIVETLQMLAIKAFPYGIETVSDDDYYYKALRCRAIINDVVEGKQGGGKLKVDENSSWFQAFRDVITTYINESVQRQGYFVWEELMSVIKKPPFGYYICNWYVYLLSRCLLPYQKWNVMQPGLHVEDKLNIVYFIMDMQTSRRGHAFNEEREPWCVWEYTDKHRFILERLNDIAEEAGYQRHKYIREALLELCFMGRDIGTHAPVSLIKSTYQELLCEYRWYDKETVSRFYNVLKYDFEGFSDAMLHTEQRIAEKLSKVFEGNKNEPIISSHLNNIFPEAAYWLYHKDMSKRIVEDFMKEEICRECGRMLIYHSRDDPDPNFPYQLENGEIFRFRIKDVKALNKKLLGRDQTSYFCLWCLAEYLDTTLESLANNITQFKEEGCKLFS